jgi:hypothetical protein
MRIVHHSCRLFGTLSGNVTPKRGRSFKATVVYLANGKLVTSGSAHAVLPSPSQTSMATSIAPGDFGRAVSIELHELPDETKPPI